MYIQVNVCFYFHIQFYLIICLNTSAMRDIEIPRTYGVSSEAKATQAKLSRLMYIDTRHMKPNCGLFRNFDDVGKF